MTAERLRIGIISGIVGIVPLLLVIVLNAISLLSNATAIASILIVFPLSILLAGILAGYRAGRQRRRRSEVKAVIGATVGAVAGVIYGGVTETLFLIRFYTTPANQRDFILISHPLRVTFAIFLLGTFISIIAMITTHFTALPLPPKGRTQEMFAVRPPTKITLPPRPQSPVR